MEEEGKRGSGSRGEYEGTSQTSNHKEDGGTEYSARIRAMDPKELNERFIFRVRCVEHLSSNYSTPDACGVLEM